MIFRNIITASFISIVIAATSWAGIINDHWTITFSERCRLETWDNATNLDDSANNPRTYTRNRTQLGVIWSPSKNASVGLRLGNEFRYYLAPTNIDFNFNEVFVDQLYLKYSLSWYQPLTFTVGRQDIMLGEGFIVMDGGPLDGSRSAYFNAVRADWLITPDHQITAFVCQQEEQDDWLPIINDRDQALVEQTETGIGVYYSGKFSQREIQGYVIHKKYSDNVAFPFNSDISTIGGRIKQPILSNLAAVVEAAYQFGDFGDASHRAFGGYGYLQYAPSWSIQHAYLPSQLTAGMIYLSGDDPETEDYEGWDPMFARWPKWSDSYIYTQISEDAVAWWTNLISLNAEAKIPLTSKAELKLAFHHLMTPQKAETSPFPGGHGSTRGELFISKLSYKFDQHWSGHLLYEGFSPGDYYFDSADDYAWIRVELMYQY